MVNETLSDQMLQLWEETDWDKEVSHSLTYTYKTYVLLWQG